MKKLMILSIPLWSVLAILLLTGVDGKAQDKEKVQTYLNEANANFMMWFNAGKIDSLASIYLENACMMPDNYHEINGREGIRDYYSYLYNQGFRFTQNQSKSVIIADSIRCGQRHLERQLFNSIKFYIDRNLSDTMETSRWKMVYRK